MKKLGSIDAPKFHTLEKQHLRKITGGLVDCTEVSGAGTRTDTAQGPNGPITRTTNYSSDKLTYDDCGEYLGGEYYLLGNEGDPLKPAE